MALRAGWFTAGPARLSDWWRAPRPRSIVVRASSWARSRRTWRWSQWVRGSDDAMEMASPATSRRAGIRGTGWGRGECTMVAAPPAFPPLVRGTPSERRPGGLTGLGSSLLATATRLRIVALHSSSFPVVGGKSRSNYARARASAGVGGSETCTDRDALRLLTMSEGALSRPHSRMPFSPAPRRVGRSSTSREWRLGLFRRRRPGSSS